MSTGEFSVYQFFEDGNYEKVREYVGGEEAAQAFTHYISSVGARIGVTRRVIITDGGDLINMEWKFEEGVVFPEQLLGKFKRGIR